MWDGSSGQDVNRFCLCKQINLPKLKLIAVYLVRLKGTTCRSIIIFFAPGINMLVTFFFLKKALHSHAIGVHHQSRCSTSHLSWDSTVLVYSRYAATLQWKPEAGPKRYTVSPPLPLKHLFLITCVMCHRTPAYSASNVCTIDGDLCKSVLRSPPVMLSRSSDQQRAPVSRVQTYPLGPRDPGDQQSPSFPGRLWPVQTNDGTTLVI